MAGGPGRPGRGRHLGAGVAEDLDRRRLGTIKAPSEARAVPDLLFARDLTTAAARSCQGLGREISLSRQDSEDCRAPAPSAAAGRRPGLHQAPRFLPLLHPMERAGVWLFFFI